MAGEVHDVVEGDGYAVAHIDAMGDDYGFRKVRRAVGVTEFGVNAVVVPPGYGGGGHFHDEQQELYFVHRGTMEFEFGDGSTHVLGPGAVARVDAATVRRFRNAGRSRERLGVAFEAFGCAELRDEWVQDRDRVVH